MRGSREYKVSAKVPTWCRTVDLARRPTSPSSSSTSSSSAFVLSASADLLLLGEARHLTIVPDDI